MPIIYNNENISKKINTMQSKHFQSHEANRKFEIWINNHPASEHDLDYMRFADMVLQYSMLERRSNWSILNNIKYCTKI